MIDFKITDNGDIDLIQPYQYPRFLLTFITPAAGKKENNVRSFPAFRIDFDTDVKQYNMDQRDFLIQFHTDLDTERDTIGANPVQGNAETAQEITIRLKTEKGEFPYLTLFGSRLIEVRHSDIKAEKTRTMLQQYAEEAIGDVEFENEYSVTAEWTDDESRYRHERIKVTIDTDFGKAYEATI